MLDVHIKVLRCSVSDWYITSSWACLVYELIEAGVASKGQRWRQPGMLSEVDIEAKEPEVHASRGQYALARRVVGNLLRDSSKFRPLDMQISSYVDGDVYVYEQYIGVEGHTDGDRKVSLVMYRMEVDQRIKRGIKVR